MVHVPIISPEEYPADYFNRKGWHSIVMQGTVNHLGQFVDIYVGWPGRVHDTLVFANSTLYKKGQSGVLLLNWTETISDKDVPLVILGDPAYLSPSLVDVAACVVLHNVCEVHGEAFDDEWMESIESSSDLNEREFGYSPSESGENIRQALTSYFQCNSI